MDRPSWLLDEPAETYEARRSRYLTSHALADFKKCPLTFQRKRLGLIPDRDSNAYLVGRALHTLVLEGRPAYEARYIAGGPINPRTGKPYGKTSQKFQEWAGAQDKEILTDSEAAAVEEMADSVITHPQARALLENGIPEGVARGHYVTQALRAPVQVPAQIRIDWLATHDNQAALVDLKTTRKMDTFVGDSHTYGYVYQLAFYRSVLRTVTDRRHTFFIVAVEKEPPYRTGAWVVDDALLETAMEANDRLVAELALCQKDDHWPSRYQEVRVLDAANINAHFRSRYTVP